MSNSLLTVVHRTQIVYFCTCEHTPESCFEARFSYLAFQVMCQHDYNKGWCCTGGDGEAHTLYVTVLLSTRLQAVHDTAKLDLLQNTSGFTHQQVWTVPRL